jgi:hypothetical protein
VIDIPLGEERKRAAIHAQYGGNGRGGISPLAHHPAVLLFSNPSNGEQHGYQDRWGTDGCFHYSGEGQTGDQVMKSGNRAILRHKEDGRQLHLFRSTRRSFVERVGRFEVDGEEPWYFDDAPGTDDVIRRMIVFRLRPVAETLPPSGPYVSAPSPDPQIEYSPVEEHVAEASTTVEARSYEARRREAELRTRYCAYLESRGHEVKSHKITPPGERRPLRTDLFDVTTNVLVEAKSNVTRESIRMAVGQLLDYSRFITPRPQLAVLVPDKPRADLLDFCAAMYIATVWEADESFIMHVPDAP